MAKTANRWFKSQSLPCPARSAARVGATATLQELQRGGLAGAGRAAQVHRQIVRIKNGY